MCERLAASVAAAVFVAIVSAGPAHAMALPQGCDQAAADKLVGKPAPSDGAVKSATGAKIIRRIAPGQPVTLDFSNDRLTLEIADGKVTAARCG